MTTLFYTLNDFNEITFSNSMTYTLESSTLEIIANLCHALNIHTAEKQTGSSGEQKSGTWTKHKLHHKKDKDMEHSWLQPAFKTTTIEKKEGTMHEIRTCLNKLSEKNYETNKTVLIELVRNANTNDLPTIATNIFDIASTNKFFSEIYAKLYKELIAEFAIFAELVQKLIADFTETMRDIRYVDPNGNYDEFCAYNKKNDARKATSVFIINLMKKGVLPVATLLDMIQTIQTMMTEYMQEANKINEVEEITENLFLFITMMPAVLPTENIAEQWNLVLANVKKIAQCKAKEYASLSSRTIFKHMDMVDSLDKKFDKKKG